MINSLFTNASKTVFNLKPRIKPIVKLITNKKIREVLFYINNKFTECTFKRIIFQYYDTLNIKEIDTEKKAVLEYLKFNPATLFPYEFTKKYKDADIKVFVDNEKKLKYVFLDNKKLYFKKNCTEKQIKKLFSSLLLVQDIESPHRYLVDGFDVSKNDIVADIGSAEGDFSLKIVEKVKRIYLFESNPELIGALQATFEPWKEKVTIVNKYVSDKITDKRITLDSFFKNKELPSFFKIDVEGAEYDLLCGAKQLLSNNKSIKIVMASYHRHNDENILREELNNKGFKTEYSKGYMLSLWDNQLIKPYLRRGLIRAIKI